MDAVSELNPLGLGFTQTLGWTRTLALARMPAVNQSQTRVRLAQAQVHRGVTPASAPPLALGSPWRFPRSPPSGPVHTYSGFTRTLAATAAASTATTTIATTRGEGGGG